MKKVFVCLLLFITISLGVVIYYKYDEWESEIKLKDYISKDEIKKLKDSDDTILATSFIYRDEFNSSNIDRYIAYSKKTNLETDKVIKLVNNNIDKLDEFVYDDIILSLLDEEYYIYNNVIRYMNYYKENKDLNTKDIVTNVNSNIDYEFYTNTSKADISKGNLILVNKFHYLESDYVPDLVLMDMKYADSVSYLTSDTYTAFKKMCDDAIKEGIKLYSVSPYRSYNLQSSLYNRYGKKDGYDMADTYSARPGFSEHQTGLAIDINSVADSFANTKEGKWLASNAYKYGFILRYPKGKEYITGYKYEPWHYRYVGEEASTYIYEHDITFEEYYVYFVEK